MRSAVYTGRVWHRRLQPATHEFGYPYLFFGLDLGESEQWRRLRPLFGLSFPCIYRLRSSGYLAPGGEPIRGKLDLAMRTAGCRTEGLRAVLLTMPSYWGYAFNPVSFYFLYDAQDRLVWFVPEVHNTFADAHVYPQRVAGNGNAGRELSFTFPKNFYVSPFLASKGEYRLTTMLDDQSFELSIELTQGGEPVFRAGFRGAGRPLSAKTLAAVLARYPLTPWLTMSRIHLQALRLRRMPKVGVHPRPETPAPATVRSGCEGLVERLRLRLLRRYFPPAEPAAKA